MAVLALLGAFLIAVVLVVFAMSLFGRDHGGRRAGRGPGSVPGSGSGGVGRGRL